MREKNKIRKVSDIPNKEGYKLIAFLKDGSKEILTVFKDENGLYRIKNFNNIIGWQPITKKFDIELDN